MKKMISLILCLALVCCLFAGCAAKTADDTTTPADASADTAQTETPADETETPAADSESDESGIEYNGKTKLVMFGPLTGDNMQYGIKIRDGAELALNQFNAAHGTNFTIEFSDDKGDPNEAVNLANKIVSDDTVAAALAGYGSSCAMATASVFDEAGMILIGVAASHADLPGMGEYVFPIPMS